MDDMLETEWIAACAHGLQRHWRTVDPVELEAVATELSHDGHLRAMRPTQAAAEWLKPVMQSDVAGCTPPERLAFGAAARSANGQKQPSR
jgi:hypothetical protein